LQRSDPILEAEGVCKTFDERDRIILDHVSLTVGKGESIAITGPSGSGKTTLLSILAGLLPADSGRLLYRFEGRQTADRLNAGLRRHHVGMVFQAIHLIPTLTVVENVEIPLFGVERDSERRQRRAHAVLDMLGLSEMASWRPNRLSGGEKQRVGVARAFANRPALVFADEPTGNLDTVSSGLVMKALTELTTESGGSLIVVTHDAAIARLMNRNLLLVDGKISDIRDLRPEDVAV
jgi:ABC-type lipoprotein export system ATPase subunit